MMVMILLLLYNKSFNITSTRLDLAIFVCKITKQSIRNCQLPSTEYLSRKSIRMIVVFYLKVEADNHPFTLTLLHKNNYIMLGLCVCLNGITLNEMQ